MMPKRNKGVELSVGLITAVGMLGFVGPAWSAPSLTFADGSFVGRASVEQQRDVPFAARWTERDGESAFGPRQGDARGIAAAVGFDDFDEQQPGVATAIAEISVEPLGPAALEARFRVLAAVEPGDATEDIFLRALGRAAAASFSVLVDDPSDPSGESTVRYRWDAVSSAWANAEGVIDDAARIADAGLMIGSTSVFDEAGVVFDGAWSPPGVRDAQRANGAGMFTAANGSSTAVSFSGVAEAFAADPIADPSSGPRESSWAVFSVRLLLWIGDKPAAPAFAPEADLLFSIDGSSAAATGGGGQGPLFDPGDIYNGQGRATIFSRPAQGEVFDDASAGLDAEIDGYDGLDVDLSEWIDFASPAGAVTPAELGSSCVHDPGSLQLSFNESDAGGSIGSDPANREYGSSLGLDEVLAWGVLERLYRILAWETAAFAESEVHPQLGPNPGPAGADNNDVDALDAVGDAACATYRYVSFDAASNPGSAAVYLVSAEHPGGLPLIDGPTHLGIGPGADIDAFEFVFRESDGVFGDPPPPYLHIIFSVAEDDPSTGTVDESGGLDPRAVYISRMDGFFRPLIVGAATGADVDAIAAWPAPLRTPPPAPTGACCLPDGSCVETTEVRCASADGAWSVGIACATAQCAQPAIGACCFGVLSCASGVAEPACVAAGGVFAGDGTSCGAVCDAVGACCVGDSCVEATATACRDELGGLYIGAGATCAETNCSAPGACCIDLTGCIELTRAECEAVGGLFRGGTTTCATARCGEGPGACCLPNGTCVEVPAAVSCVPLGGVYRGADTTCASAGCPAGACCYACLGGDASAVDCGEVPREECEALGGRWRGVESSCDDPVRPCGCPGDVDGNGRTEILDFMLLANNFGHPREANTAPGYAYDFDCSGVVDVGDFFILAGSFGCVEPGARPLLSP